MTKEVSVGCRKKFLALSQVIKAHSNVSILQDLEVERYSLPRILEDLDILLPEAWRLDQVISLGL